MSEYQNLLARKAEIDAQIAAAQAEAKAKAVTEARALIQEHGLTAADVFPAPARPRSAWVWPSTATRHRRHLDRARQAAELDQRQGPRAVPDRPGDRVSRPTPNPEARIAGFVILESSCKFRTMSWPC